VIAAHQCITENDVNGFIDNVSRLKANSILFSPKKIADQGGVHRLFTLTQKGQELIRSLELDSAVSKIAQFDGGDLTLIVLAENILSGGQLEGNFKWHYLSMAGRNGPYIDKQRLFEIEDIKDDLLRGFKRFRKVLILAAAHTNRGADRLREYLSTALEIPLGYIEVQGTLLKDSACFFGESEDISAASKSALTTLICDMERIRSVFQVDDEKNYLKSLDKIDNANLIVRPNSVPKMGLRIFTLPSRNMNIPPLFRKTKEHE